MSQFFETACRPDTAAGAIAQHLRVKTPGAVAVAGASDVAFGTMELPCLAAGDCTVRLVTAQGTRKMVASEAITAGNPVYAASGGKVAASGTVIEGRAMETVTANNDVIEVMSLANSDISSSLSGTTAAGFVVDSDSSTPKIKLLGSAGGTGDYTTTLTTEATLSGNNTIIVPEANGDTLAAVALAQTLTNKTLTAPVLTSPVLTTPTFTQLTETVAATNVIAASESGTVFFLSHATEFVSTLPAPAAGLRFTFIVANAPESASYTIVSNSSANIIIGQIYTTDVNSATDPDFETSGGDTITLVDAKAVVGDRVEVFCDGTNWFVYGFCSVFDAITITGT